MNTITVKVGVVPGTIKEVILNEGATVADALEVAGMSAEGYEIRVNNAPATTSTGVEDGDIVALARMIKGN